MDKNGVAYLETREKGRKIGDSLEDRLLLVKLTAE